MKPIQVTDEWLYRYMPIVDEAIVRELEDNTDYEYEFSNKFKRRMNKLIWTEAHSWFITFSKISKKVGIFLFGMICSVFLLTISVEAYRIQFFETVKTIWEDSILYRYLKKTNIGEFQISEPSYIPQGYEEAERIESDTMFSVVYENDLGEIITWDQMLVLDGGNLVVDLEYDSQIVKIIDGDEADIFLYSDGYVGAYYEHGEYVYLLTAESLSIEEICSILGSIY